MPQREGLTSLIRSSGELIDPLNGVPLKDDAHPHSLAVPGQSIIESRGLRDLCSKPHRPTTIV